MKNRDQHELEDVFKGLAVLAVILGFIVNWTFAFYVFIGASILITINHFREGDSSGENTGSSNNRSIFAPNIEVAFAWPELGEFDVEVVGESNYQSNISAIAGAHDHNGPTGTHTAHLIPEDDNQYDAKAIRVDINGKTVGYLSRDEAPSFRRRLSSKKLKGKTTSCKASLIGGHNMRDNTKASYGVMLDLKAFD